LRPEFGGVSSAAPARSAGPRSCASGVAIGSSQRPSCCGWPDLIRSWRPVEVDRDQAGAPCLCQAGRGVPCKPATRAGSSSSSACPVRSWPSSVKRTSAPPRRLSRQPPAAYTTNAPSNSWRPTGMV
jgi:hypothetical protein